jgi:hypothetical protein
VPGVDPLGTFLVADRLVVTSSTNPTEMFYIFKKSKRLNREKKRRKKICEGRASNGSKRHLLVTVPFQISIFFILKKN